MLTDHEKQKITQLVHHWVVPAIGCTEPICVALAAARAAQELHSTPTHIRARLSANILKNAMGVGIPGTGMVGLPIAIAIGALAGDASKGLEVLGHCTPEDVDRGKAFIAEDRIEITLAEDAPEKLYVDVTLTDSDQHQARVVIAREHTHIVSIEHDGHMIESHPLQTSSTATERTEEELQLCLHKVWEYATTMPEAEIEFIN